MSFIERVFDPRFMPHGHCFFWDPWILWSNVSADMLIAFSYFSIPVALIYFVRRRTDLQFNWIFVLFAVFIFACGTTHLIEIWNIWNASYALSAVVKMVTAAASLATAVLLWKLIPKLLQIPSRIKLDEANEALSQEVEARKNAQKEIINLNRDLANRIQQASRIQQETLSYFKALSDNIMQLVLITDHQGAIEYVNAPFAAYSGYSSAPYGKWQDMIHPDDLDSCLKRWVAALESGQPYSTLCRLRDSSGNYNSFSGHVYPLKDQDGVTTRWMGTFTLEVV